MAPSSATPSWLLPGYLHVLAFLGGFNVMLLEMCGFRVLQTTFGSSIYVTGVLLALVMIALSVGYFLGGRFSHRFGSLEFLLGVLVSAAVYVFVVDLLLAEAVLDACFHLRETFSGTLTQHVIPPAVATLVLYGPPMLALSHVSPYLIKLLTSQPDLTGSRGVGATAGNLMAVSNVGSIAGTSLPSFVLIPQLGVPTTLGIFLGSLGGVVVAGFLLSRRRAVAAAVASLVLVGVATGPELARARAAASAGDSAPVFSAESLYGNVKIFRSTDRDGDEHLEYMPSRDFVHSNVYPGRPLKDQFTTSYVNMGLARGARRYLVLGVALGGGVAAVLAADPEAQVTAVEIDPLVARLARRFVPALEDPRVRMVVQDARLFLREDTGTYDYIVADVFAGEQIPAHCITQEFFALARERLAEDGVLFLNSNLWDYRITSGLEQPEPSVPVRHVQSALLHAGFASLFQNDFFEHGHIYAFRQPTSLESVRRLLSERALDSRIEPNLRASLAVASLSLMEVPAERRELRPITDAWVPEHQLHLKGNIEQYLVALQDARSRPEWKRVVEQEGAGQLRFISASHYARVGEVFSPGYEGYKAYIQHNGTELCRDVLGWAAQQQGDPYPELLSFVHTRVLKRCERAFTSAELPIPTEGAAPLVRQYAAAATLVDENQGEKALPLLTGLLARRP
ncbi:spermidine synthase [Cystobacter ferrugineus]|uniref:PABS domain-containing protein n=1 Tax=Cystobacter ferrugineus TaxID=83449 RepID=A0A1L9B8K5_9BACT|nr:fused MFS/spermidine synthase [Cystobacter ferrugineus]OJH38582.1 hypothetical protein BON30_20275 [Cystobacter ferrugineus]